MKIVKVINRIVPKWDAYKLFWNDKILNKAYVSVILCPPVGIAIQAFSSKLFTKDELFLCLIVWVFSAVVCGLGYWVYISNMPSLIKGKSIEDVATSDMSRPAFDRAIDVWNFNNQKGVGVRVFLWLTLICPFLSLLLIFAILF